MIRTKKYYFLPFVDNLTAVGIALLFIIMFGNWLNVPAFSAVATFFMIFTLCGRVYVRMWNLSRKNTARRYGLTIENCVKFMLPLDFLLQKAKNSLHRFSIMVLSIHKF